MEGLSLKSGSDFTGSSLKPFAGNVFIVPPLRTGSIKGMMVMSRYGSDLAGVDAFVCTEDPMVEPPTMVINTVLSVMAYDYPLEKLLVFSPTTAAPISHSMPSPGGGGTDSVAISLGEGMNS